MLLTKVAGSPNLAHVPPPSCVTKALLCPNTKPSVRFRNRIVRGASPSVTGNEAPTWIGRVHVWPPSAVWVTELWQVGLARNGQSETSIQPVDPSSMSWSIANGPAGDFVGMGVGKAIGETVGAGSGCGCAALRCTRPVAPPYAMPATASVARTVVATLAAN